MHLSNPLSFTPMAVATTVVMVYLAVFVPLLYVHETVPAAPGNPLRYRGLNLTEAWLDLQELSSAYHPYNSRRNDEVRDWLLRRVEAILEADERGAGLGKEEGGDEGELRMRMGQEKESKATVFNDITSNFTGTALINRGSSGRNLSTSTYFEGNNIIVYVRGTEDEEGEWWNDDISVVKKRKTHGRGGVMVNAHFDSVSTGYGATDDGMGVITALQLIKYYTTDGNTPKKGLVVLLNNGEEDGLYGAKAFLEHPMASFVHTFLNLEGAGAGGRATLFRSTDTEVTRAYAKARHPLGTVLVQDGFSSGFIASQTDYFVFEKEGYRGLDVAFWEPRARYHTDQDDAKHASRASLWHMLEASLETTRFLTADTSSQFDRPRSDRDGDKVQNGGGSNSVWFDLFGEVFAVFELRTIFAWSLTLLIVGPLALILVTILLIKKDKYYFFSGSVKSNGFDSDYISLGGWRGFFRFPLVLGISGALTVAAAFLLRKINPLIIFSSVYSVWAMSLSLFFCSFWFLMAGCNHVRPSALYRGYAIIWMNILGWLVLVVTTLGQDRFKISGGYVFVFYYGAILLATLISLLELFALPTKHSIADHSHNEHENRDASQALLGAGSTHETDNGDSEATENTPLIGGQNDSSSITFSQRYRQAPANDDEADDEVEPKKKKPYGGEQKWSADLPMWSWLVQFLLLGPYQLIVFGEIGLLIVAATDQTGTDGSSLLVPYLIVAIVSIFVLLPVTPFIHRISHQLPTFLFLVFAGTVIYNLLAFPFSSTNRYKAYFQQTIDLDGGVNSVTILGIEEYVRQIVSEIPSTSGQKLSCSKQKATRAGMSLCSYTGIPPQVVKNVKSGVPPQKGYKDWISLNITRTNGTNRATFRILAKETKQCIIRFDDPFSVFHVHGAASNPKWKGVPEQGSDQIKLWHRDWNKEWKIDVEWPISSGKKSGDEGRSGRVACGWADHNGQGTIPALDEFQRFAPEWTSAVKMSEALVEGSVAFVV
ncbi:putative zinc metalloprotease [Calycina marina]|uniref:Peptide hydrolase n=1 Tax=Calycina marina TaxID=1763456 RepID=A0A9P8CFU2_9HELO|nr:putative zinc metalloprotease [Calycina marina]